jgi:hypothetical protein
MKIDFTPLRKIRVVKIGKEWWLSEITKKARTRLEKVGIEIQLR